MSDLIDLGQRRQQKSDVLEDARQRIEAKLKAQPRRTYRSDEVCAERIVFAREMLGFSQDDFAEVLQVPIAEYQAWENGTQQPTPEQLKDLADLTSMFTIGWFCSPMTPGWTGPEQTTLRFH